MRRVALEKCCTFRAKGTDYSGSGHRHQGGNTLVVLIGQRKALALAVKNNRTENRFSGLLARLTA
jgi:hypothetical protein